MFKKEYTIDNFRINDYKQKIISATGHFKSNKFMGKYWDINYSDILSKLIVETGRLVEHYASDLFISWQTIEKQLENPDYKGGIYLFGLREMGVDHAEYVINRFNNEDKREYRKIYMLIVNVEEDGDIVMKFGEAEAY